MASRYELKYLITNALSLKVRDFIQQYLDFDEFAVGQPNYSYPVHSLYLDSDDWQIYWRTVNGDKNRYKLRVRYYNESPKTPVFFEIKRRMKDVILKKRCGVKREAAAMILAGHLPEAHQRTSRSATEEVAMQEFMHLMFSVGAKPKMHVAYDREAYVNDYNNEIRVTMDRNVRVVPRFNGDLTVKMEDPYFCTGSDGASDIVILELKFTNRFPNWYRDLVQRFNLPLMSAAKYVEGTTLYKGRDLPEHDVIRNMLL